MFTGIITAIGRIDSIAPLGENKDAVAAGESDFGYRMRIAVDAAFSTYLDDVGLGDSIAINGACMTVTEFDTQAKWFTFDISAESISKIAPFAKGQRVNLEKALAAHDRLGGHIVSGHVDTTGRVVRFEPVGESWELCIAVSRDFAKFMAYKGSVAIQGTSLTVNSVQDNADDCAISINLIPHTIESTTLGDLKAGSAVNVEVDVFARYCERMLHVAAQQT